MREIRDRLTFLVDVGLDYLSLARGTPTLSGGESQRIRLASQIGSGLTGVLYVLDEPTIGLHPRDNTRLLAALRHLRDLGNTLVLVEHDREVIEAADHLVDFGPGSGEGGGKITASGPPEKVKASAKSLTGAIPQRQGRDPGADQPPAGQRRGRRAGDRDPRCAAAQPQETSMSAFPLGVVTVVTGVSGSGKSSLVEDILWKAAAKTLHRAELTPGAHEAIEGLEHIDKVISVDQTPLGVTPNSTPATYSGVFDLIRELFAKLPEAKVRGYTSRRFSFNQAGGRCEACEGAGQKRIEMHFLPDVWITCDACGGARYTPETLAVKFHGKTIADVLDMSVDGALELFASVPRIRRILQTLHDVGLGYIPLGQAAPTLSGGEAQRVKLAAELARPDTGKTLYILDEPTTGLHFDDVRKLLDVIHRLADLGNTVVVIEHNLEVIKTADWVIDLGPEAGAGGGELVAEGTPDEVARNPRSHTARFLQGLLAAGPFAERPEFDPKAAAHKALEAAKSSNDKVQPRTVEKEARKGKRQAEPAAESSASAQAPWEIDGRKWHTRDRVARNGRPARWDGRILELVVDRVEKLGAGCFAPTEWSQRGVVRIDCTEGQKKNSFPFFHATTSGEWVVTLRFFVPRNTFQAGTLENAARARRLPREPDARAQRRPADQGRNQRRPDPGDHHHRPFRGRLRDPRLRRLPDQGRGGDPGPGQVSEAEEGQRAVRFSIPGIGFLSPFAWPFRSGSRWRIMQVSGNGRTDGRPERGTETSRSARLGRGGDGPRDGNGIAAPGSVVAAGPKKRLLIMTRRSRGREVALQVLYQVEQNPGVPVTEIHQFIDRRTPGRAEARRVHRGPDRRGQGTSAPDRRNDLGGRRELAAGPHGRHRSQHPAAGSLRDALLPRGPGQGRHQRGPRAGQAVQHRPVEPVRQRHPRPGTPAPRRAPGRRQDRDRG